MILKKQITDRWTKLGQRERIIVLAGGVVAVILLIYLLVWDPLINATDAARKDVNSQRDLVVWMQHAVPRLKFLYTSGVKKQTIGKESLLAFLDKSSRSFKLHKFITQLEQSSDQKQITIQLAKVPFDELIGWLTFLWKNYGISVVSGSFYKLPNVGYVRASIEMR